MQTKKQVNKVLLRCKGGAHQKDIKKRKLTEHQRMFINELRNLNI